MRQEPDKIPKPLPGVLATLVSGFEFTTSHPWLTTLPILLDIFLWLGPRLRISYLLDSMLDDFGLEPPFVETFEEMNQPASGFNLSTNLSTPLISVPALMAGLIPLRTPVVAMTFQIETAAQFLIVFAAITLGGLLITAMYFSLLGEVLRYPRRLWRLRGKELAVFVRSVAVVWLRLLALGIFFIVTMLILLLPLLPVAFLAALVSQELAIMAVGLAFLAVIAYLSMSIPGIVLDGYPVGTSILRSLRMVRHNLRPTMNFLLFVFVIGWGTSLLWRLADSGTWLSVFGIAGNAFIANAMVFSIFIFYRDRSSMILNQIEEI